MSADFFLLKSCILGGAQTALQGMFFLNGISHLLVSVCGVRPGGQRLANHVGLPKKIFVYDPRFQHRDQIV